MFGSNRRCLRPHTVESASELGKATVYVLRKGGVLGPYHLALVRSSSSLARTICLIDYCECERQHCPRKHLTQSELAARWRMSPRTLERWRWLRQGPAFLKLGKGGHVVYRVEDIEHYEFEHLELSKSASLLKRKEDPDTRHDSPHRESDCPKQAGSNCCRGWSDQRT
jgi:hypothetical protein